jgi:hypothetical protein
MIVAPSGVFAYLNSATTIRTTLINPHAEFRMMSRPALTTGLLIVVLLLAGCNFLGTAPSRHTPRVTPADVPTDSPTATPREQIAPGVLPEEVYNASALAHAHYHVLGSTSFTIQLNRTYRYPNGTLAEWDTKIVQVSTEPSLRIRSRSRDRKRRFQSSKRSPIVRIGRWGGPDQIYWRITFVNNTTTYRTASPRGSSELYRLTNARMIERMLTDVDTQIIPLTRGDSMYYRIEGPISLDYRYPLLLDNPYNASQWLLIDSRGVVHEQHITAHTTGPTGTPLRMRLTITYQQIGNTTVERPAWIKLARNRSKVDISNYNNDMVD